MRLIRAIVVTLTLLYSVTVQSQDAAPEQAVLRAVNCFTDSWNRHDLRLFGLCFAPDADFVNVTAQWWKGRTALEKNHAYLHGTIEASDTTGVTVQPRGHGIFRGTTLTFTSTDVRFARPDLAVVHATWRMTDDARTPEPRTGVMTLVVLNNAGSWQITAVHNTEIARAVR